MSLCFRRQHLLDQTEAADEPATESPAEFPVAVAHLQVIVKSSWKHCQICGRSISAPDHEAGHTLDATRRDRSSFHPAPKENVMPIEPGSHLPHAKFKILTGNGPADVSTEELFAGKKAVLFAVPGAFTPTCSITHLPGFIEHADEFKAKGIDIVACTAVNDVFVLDAWAKSTGAVGKVVFLADGSGDFAKAIGLDLDAGAFGLGLRSKRYAMLLEDGVVKALHVEDKPSEADASSAERLLAEL